MHTLRAIRSLRLARPQYQQFIWTASRTISSESTPWFVDQDEQLSTFARRPPPPHIPEPPFELPAGIPDPIRVLYTELSTSPFLEPSTLVAREPPRIPPGPPLPRRQPRGRRRVRGKTYAGESLLDASGGIWSWVVMAQVCSTQFHNENRVYGICYFISGQRGHGRSRRDRVSCSRGP